ncbi:hypothetical protein CK203_050049 [Vitis vinifera]|uniref:GAG-pre-integrase domain-containing protein n=1 Tax=Vitis vinifera TaxID=29760 RepID=A0A438H535_VITVI|nr:hypothetical protein CK203_050049 [Vitis vinifera]
MGQGYEDHLVTPEDAIPDVDKAKGLCTNDIQRFYKVVSDIVHVRQQDMDLFTYIGRIASLKEEFLTLMPFTNGAKTQQIQTNKFFMVLTLIGLHPDLESVRDQILASPSVPSLDDVFARLLRLSFTQTLSTDSPLDSSVLASQTHSRGGRSGNRVEDNLHGRPPRTAHIAQSSDPLQSRPDSAVSSTSQSITLIGSDYDAYLRYQATTSASVAQTDRSTRKTIGIRRESQGLYHLTSPSSPVAYISTDAPLLIHSRLGHPSLSKFQKMVPRFSTLSSLACESCQLGKHTCVSFPKRLNNRAKSHFELVHTDVWGPCWTASTLGFQYFVTFIDNYSRLTMLGNIFLHRLLLLCPNMGSSINPLMLTLLNKMGTSSPPRLRNASSWDTLDFRRAIIVIPLTLIVIFSPLMSHSLRTLHSFHPLNLFPFLKYCHFPIVEIMPKPSLIPAKSFWPYLNPIISLSLSHSGHQSLFSEPREKTLSSQSNSRQKTLTAGNFSGELFRRIFRRTATVFFYTARSAWRRSPICPKAPEPETHPRRPRAFFRPATASHAPAREPLSGDALPPPGSPDADQPPFLPVCAIRALHVPLLGFFCFRGPSDQIFRRPSAIFSQLQSLHVP